MNVVKWLIYALGLIAVSGFNFAYADDELGEFHASHIAVMEEDVTLVEPEWNEDPSNEMSDSDLLNIEGKGWTPGKINENDALAVILWDERGSGRKTTLSDNNYSHQQTVTLKFNQR